MHERSTPVFIDLRSQLMLFGEKICPPIFFNENVALQPTESVNKSLIDSEISKRDCSNLPTCDQNLILVMGRIAEMTHDFETGAKRVGFNRDGCHATSFDAECACTRPQLSFDDRVELESEDSWDSSPTSAKMCGRSRTSASYGKTSDISVNEIIRKATDKYLINAEFSWCEHLSDDKAEKLVTHIVTSSIEEWCHEHFSNPKDVHESTRILAHAIILASAWHARENTQPVLIANLMSASHE